jgi:DNA modification methylase
MAILELNKIYQGDCINLLKQISDNSIDLIFADPPYNMQLQSELYRPNNTKVNGVDDKWDKFADFKEYDDFCIAWLKECKRILKS